MPDERCRIRRRRLARREQLTRARTRVKNDIHASLQRRLQARPPCSDLFGVKGRQWLAGLELPVEERESVDAGICQIEFLDAEIAAVERLIARQALSWPEIRRLMTVPGVNLVCAATFIAAVGNANRFLTGWRSCSGAGIDRAGDQPAPIHSSSGDGGGVAPSHARGGGTSRRPGRWSAPRLPIAAWPSCSRNRAGASGSPRRELHRGCLRIGKIGIDGRDRRLGARRGCRRETEAHARVSEVLDRVLLPLSAACRSRRSQRGRLRVAGGRSGERTRGRWRRPRASRCRSSVRVRGWAS